MFNKQLITTHQEAIKALTEGKSLIIVLNPAPESSSQRCYLQQLDNVANPQTWTLGDDYTPEINFDDSYWIPTNDDISLAIDTFELLSENIELIYVCNRMIILDERDHKDRMTTGEMLFALSEGNAIGIDTEHRRELSLIQFNSDGNLVVYKGLGGIAPWELDPETSSGDLMTLGIMSSTILEPLLV